MPVNENGAFMVKFNDHIVIDINTFHHRFHVIASEAIENGHGIGVYNGKIYDERNSYVLGYVWENVFIGMIQLNGVIYHLERLNDFGTESKLKAVMYRADEAKYESPGDDAMAMDMANHIPKLKRQILSPSVASFFPKGKICVVEVIADHTFHKKHGKRTKSELYIIMRQVNRIYESHDFDGDGVADRLGIRVGHMIVFTKEDKNNRFYRKLYKHQRIERTLETINEYRNDYCLRIVFVNRDFSQKYRNSTNGITLTKGVCLGMTPIQAIPIEGNETVYGGTKLYNPNGILITALGLERNLTRTLIIKNVAHEIGHTFGAHHDQFYGKRHCIINQFGGYIMDEISQSYVELWRYPNYWKHSECTRKAIYEHLNHPIHSNCFEDNLPPECGDYIVEGKEYCDAGSLTLSEYIDPCCDPKLCVKKSHVKCHPNEGDCCNAETCNIVSAEERKICRRECFRPSHCNGINAYCPNMEVIMPPPNCSSCAKTFCRCASNGSGKCRNFYKNTPPKTTLKITQEPTLKTMESPKPKPKTKSNPFTLRPKPSAIPFDSTTRIMIYTILFIIFHVIFYCLCHFTDSGKRLVLWGHEKFRAFRERLRQRWRIRGGDYANLLRDQENVLFDARGHDTDDDSEY